MSDLLTPTLSSFIATIQADAGVSALVDSRVFDHVPSIATFPYLVVQVVEGRDAGTKTFPAQSLLFAIQVFHRPHCGADVRQVVAALRDCLQDATLSNVARCQEEFFGVFASQETMRAIVRYRVIVSS